MEITIKEAYEKCAKIKYVQKGLDNILYQNTLNNNEQKTIVDTVEMLKEYKKMIEKVVENTKIDL